MAFTLWNGDEWGSVDRGMAWGEPAEHHVCPHSVRPSRHVEDDCFLRYREMTLAETASAKFSEAVRFARDTEAPAASNDLSKHAKNADMACSSAGLLCSSHPEYDHSRPGSMA